MPQHSRRDFIRSLTGGVLAAGAATAANGRASRAAGSQPNVLLVFPDQWRRQTIGCYGDPVVLTPNVDRLAAEGVRFTRCYTPNPECTPARAALLTGLYPHQTRVTANDMRLPTNYFTLAEDFRSAGYATGYIGKWHLDGAARPGFVAPGPSRQGFQWFEGFNVEHRYPNPRYYTNEGQLVEPGVFESYYQTDLALSYMRDHSDEPFFLCVSYGPPHTPYWPPDEFKRLTDADLRWRPNVPVGFQADPAHAKEVRGYYGLCETVDHELGRLLSHLDDSGLASNTLVLFASDHGDMHGSHGLRRKYHPEEESVGIPLIARLPGAIPPGQVTGALTSLIDLKPSVLSLCGVTERSPGAGQDLSAAFRGQPVADRSVYLAGRMWAQTPSITPDFLGHSYGEWRAMVTPQHKLVVDIAGDVRTLVDLQSDPYEMNNLAGTPGVEGLEAQLLQELRDMGLQTGDPFGGPYLEWAGDSGYKNDGYAPAVGSPESTTFTFRARLTSPDGLEPERSYVKIRRLEDGREWKTLKTVRLTRESGQGGTPAVVTASAQLPNGSYRYRFQGEDALGRPVVGDPSDWRRGPQIEAAPQLWCSGLWGRRNDFVHPNEGEAWDTKFRFSVLYTDGTNQAPAVSRIDIQKLRSDGTWRDFVSEQVPAGNGLPCNGQYFTFKRGLPAGQYRHRFFFRDADGNPADGRTSEIADATEWHPGPLVDRRKQGGDSGQALVQSLVAHPTPQGAQIDAVLTHAARVQARAMTIAGRPVRMLCRGKECGAGANTLLWNARSDEGLRVPGGVYLVEVMARAPDGGQSRALTQVRIGR